jgi:hypothetical protein
VIVYKQYQSKGEKPRLLSKSELEEEMWRLGDNYFLVRALPVIEDIDELNENDSVIIMTNNVQVIMEDELV